MPRRVKRRTSKTEDFRLQIQKWSEGDGDEWKRKRRSQPRRAPAETDISPGGAELGGGLAGPRSPGQERDLQRESTGETSRASIPKNNSQTDPTGLLTGILIICILYSGDRPDGRLMPTGSPRAPAPAVGLSQFGSFDTEREQTLCSRCGSGCARSGDPVRPSAAPGLGIPLETSTPGPEAVNYLRFDTRCESL